MVKLVIGGIDVSEYVTDNYKINRTPNNYAANAAGGNTFENWDGTVIYLDGTVRTAKEIPPFKTTVSAELEDVPDGIASAVARATGGTPNTVSLVYSTPDESAGPFTCTNYSAEVDENDFDTEEDRVKTWKINLTLESAESAASDTAESGGL